MGKKRSGKINFATQKISCGGAGTHGGVEQFAEYVGEKDGSSAPVRLGALGGSHRAQLWRQRCHHYHPRQGWHARRVSRDDTARS